MHTSSTYVQPSVLPVKQHNYTPVTHCQYVVTLYSVNDLALHWACLLLRIVISDSLQAEKSSRYAAIQSRPSRYQVTTLGKLCLYRTGLDWVEFNAPPDIAQVISEAVFTANHLTVTDKQTIRKKINTDHKNTHINTIQIKEKTTKHTAETKLPWFSCLLRHKHGENNVPICSFFKATKNLCCHFYTRNVFALKDITSHT